MKHKQCPACQSLNSKVTPKLVDCSGMQAFKNRVCNDCGTIWRPQSPRWLGIPLIVIGIALAAMGTAATNGIADVDAMLNKQAAAKPHDRPDWIYYVAGGVPVVAGVGVLSGKMGKLKILGKAEKEGKQE